jgi:hypothetical protein
MVDQMPNTGLSAHHNLNQAEDEFKVSDENASKRLVSLMIYHNFTCFYVRYQKKDMPPPQIIRKPSSASNRSIRKKLTAPFRSPLMQKTPFVVDSAPLTELGLAKQLIYPPTTKANKGPEYIPETTPHIDFKKSHTSRAAKQFKLPLSVSPPSSSGSSFSAVQLAPTIQSLERKIQVLKRAIKVKRDGEEEELEGLIKKWKEVGREVAWEVWGLVKDNKLGGDQDGWSKREGMSGKATAKRGFDEGWGWDENDDARKPLIPLRRTPTITMPARDPRWRRAGIGILMIRTGARVKNSVSIWKRRLLRTRKIL